MYKYRNLWDGCIGAWCPSQGATGALLLDRSGRNNHGTLTNMDPGTDWVASEGKVALDFDGSDDYVATQSPGVLGSNARTISCWFSGTSAGCLVCWGSNSGAGDRCQFGLASTTAHGNPIGQLWFEINGAVFGAGPAVLDGKWHHLAMTYPGAVGISTSLVLYVDGVAYSTLTGNVYFQDTPNTGSSSPVAIGFNNVDSVLPIPGKMDDVRIYNRALSPSEIAVLASRRGIAYERIKKTILRVPNRPRSVVGGWSAPYTQTNASLKNGLAGAWIPSLGSSGPTLLDRSGRNNHGTLTNMDPGTDWVASEGKVALDFDGVNDCVDISPPAEAKSGDLTVALWAKVLTMPSSSDGVMFHLGDFSVDRAYFGIQTSGNGNRITFAAYSSGFIYGIYYPQFSGGPVCPSGRWFHACGVLSGGTYSLYVDGKLEASITETAIAGPNALISIGDVSSTNGGRGTRNCNFQSDDIRLYNRALTPGEVRALASRRGIGFETERRVNVRKVVSPATNNAFFFSPLVRA